MTAEQIEIMKQLKGIGNQLQELFTVLEASPDVDRRWLAIGKTDLQKGIMGTVRAIAKPEVF